MNIIGTCLLAAVLFATAEFQAEAQRRRVASGPNGSAEFDCPDEFGYYPHPTDCTQYYVCVFGGALLESCTGGLMYSHELQTCDWPRNVGCGENAAAAAPSQGVSTVRVTDSRTSTNNWRAGHSTPAARPIQHQQIQQQNQYEDVGEEEIIDRQQRVNRGQPNTVGQVARDRDGARLSVTNIIPLQANSGRSIGDKTYVAAQQYTRPTQYAPTTQAPVQVAANNTYGYEDYAYDEYEQQYPTAVEQQQQQQQQPQQPLYRGQYTVQTTAAAPAIQQEYRPSPSYAAEPAVAQPQYPANNYDYDAYQTDDEIAYQQPSPQPTPKQSSRGSSSSKHSTEHLTTTTTTTTTTTIKPSVAPITESVSSRSSKQRSLVRPTSSPDMVYQPERQQKSISNRGSTKARTRISDYEAIDAGDEDLPSGGYDSDNRVSESPVTSSRARPTATAVEASGNSQRGKSSSSSRGRGSVKAASNRPTLKPSANIVSKAVDFIDIYRFPPSRPEPIYPTPRVDQTAAKCRKDVCLLPDCYCGGKDVPGGFAAEQIPQIVLLTFDDSVNDLNKGLYESLFERGRVNPNGCPIAATFYVSHEWTDYSQVQNLYADGHEMASHSISHSFGEQFSQKKWTREIAGQREILSAYGGVKLEDVRGMRAPFLAVGGNKMFKMLYDANFTYDSSMPVYENRPPSYPYTLDYKLFHDCMIPPCPTKSYPGVWEVPMVMWQDLNGGRCSMGDACSNPPTADGVYKMLIKNFERHYTTNRAPFGLYYHAAWFTQPHHKEGFEAFLDTIVAMDDVWLTTNWQAIQWMRDPTPLSSVKNFAPFGCNYQSRPKRCSNPKVCNLWHKSGVRYMRTCQPCPDAYPWTGKTGVRNSRVDNNEIDE